MPATDPTDPILHDVAAMFLLRILGPTPSATLVAAVGSKAGLAEEGWLPTSGATDYEGLMLMSLHGNIARSLVGTRGSAAHCSTPLTTLGSRAACHYSGPAGRLPRSPCSLTPHPTGPSASATRLFYLWLRPPYRSALLQEPRARS